MPEPERLLYRLRNFAALPRLPASCAATRNFTSGKSAGASRGFIMVLFTLAVSQNCELPHCIDCSVVVTSVQTIQGKADRTDPVLISLCSSVVQYRSSTAHAESAERPVCQ